MAIPLNLVGQKFGKLMVVGPTEKEEGCKTQGTRWLCLCDCGGTAKAFGGALNAGRVKDCSDCRSHGQTKGGKLSYTYQSWRGMKERCLNEKHASYRHYGGRGISFCDRWKSFANFLEDMGERPRGLTLDRIEVDGNYNKENCKWSTPTEQARNSRSNKLDLEKVCEIRKLISEGVSEPKIAKEFGISNGYVNNVKQRLSWKEV